MGRRHISKAFSDHKKNEKKQAKMAAKMAAHSLTGTGTQKPTLPAGKVHKAPRLKIL